MDMTPPFSKPTLIFWQPGHAIGKWVSTHRNVNIWFSKIKLIASVPTQSLTWNQPIPTQDWLSSKSPVKRTSAYTSLATWNEEPTANTLLPKPPLFQANFARSFTPGKHNPSRPYTPPSYASSVWNPHRRADVRIIKNVQNRGVMSSRQNFLFHTTETTETKNYSVVVWNKKQRNKNKKKKKLQFL